MGLKAIFIIISITTTPRY